MNTIQELLNCKFSTAHAPVWVLNGWSRRKTNPDSLFDHGLTAGQISSKLETRRKRFWIYLIYVYSWLQNAKVECESYLLPRYSMISVVRVDLFLSWNARNAAYLNNADAAMQPKLVGVILSSSLAVHWRAQDKNTATLPA